MKHAPVIAIACAALVACSAPQEYVFGSGPPQSEQAAKRILIGPLTRQISPPLDSPLQLLQVTLPQYPAAIRVGASAREGMVEIEFLINSNGTVTEAAPIGRPDSVLAAICKDAVLAWRFAPISRNGAPTTLRLKYEFVFRLDRPDWIEYYRTGIEPELNELDLTSLTRVGEFIQYKVRIRYANDKTSEPLMMQADCVRRTRGQLPDPHMGVTYNGTLGREEVKAACLVAAQIGLHSQ